MQGQKHTNTVFIYIIVIVLVIAIGTACYVLFKSVIHGNSSMPEQATQSNGVPQAKVIDTAPQVPSSQKTSVTIMQSDSTYVKYLVPSKSIQEFIHTLPPGSSVISQSPM